MPLGNRWSTNNSPLICPLIIFREILSASPEPAVQFGPCRAPLFSHVEKFKILPGSQLSIDQVL